MSDILMFYTGGLVYIPLFCLAKRREWGYFQGLKKSKNSTAMAG